MEALKERTIARLPHIPLSLGPAILPIFYDAPITSAEEQRLDHVQHSRRSLADRLYNGTWYSGVAGLGSAAILVAHKTVETLVEGKSLADQRFDSAGYAMGIGFLAAVALISTAKLAEYFSRKKNGTGQS